MFQTLISECLKHLRYNRYLSKGFRKDCSLFLANKFYSLQCLSDITVTGLVEKCKELIEKKEISMNVVFLLFLTLKKRNISMDEFDIKSYRELLFETPKFEVEEFFESKMVESDLDTKTKNKIVSLQNSGINIECDFHLQNLNPPEFVEPKYINYFFSNRKNPGQVFFFDYEDQSIVCYN